MVCCVYKSVAFFSFEIIIEIILAFAVDLVSNSMLLSYFGSPSLGSVPLSSTASKLFTVGILTGCAVAPEIHSCCLLF